MRLLLNIGLKMAGEKIFKKEKTDEGSAFSD